MSLWHVNLVKGSRVEHMKRRLANLTEIEQLDYLVDVFKSESAQYSGLETPDDVIGKRRLLRSLMNVRMPRHLDDMALQIQNEYLQSRAKEHGVVELHDIPIREGVISIWQGDITADSGSDADRRLQFAGEEGYSCGRTHCAIRPDIRAGASACRLLR